MKKSTLVSFMSILIPMMSWAQPFGPRASITVPSVDGKGSVFFSVNAPKASSVSVSLLMERLEMKKGENGQWSCTTAPLSPGFHAYTIYIDDVPVLSPAGDIFKSMGQNVNGLEVEEKGCEDFCIGDVPHGKISDVMYWSDVCGEYRHLKVYTPHGYDKSGTDYPVVYLQHGGGEDETSWFAQGRASNILDAAIADGRAVPMIVVCANGNVPGGARYSREGVEPFRKELLNNIIPTIEKEFRVRSDRKGRALCGLSMGGGLSFFIGLNAPEVFAHVGVFSAGMFSGFGRESDVDLEKEIPGIFSDTGQFNKSFNLFMMTCGEQDSRISGITEAVHLMKENGVDVKLLTYPGDHEWQVWRKSFRDFIPGLFR